jgi:hypothetical protein
MHERETLIRYLLRVRLIILWHLLVILDVSRLVRRVLDVGRHLLIDRHAALLASALRVLIMG